MSDREEFLRVKFDDYKDTQPAVTRQHPVWVRPSVAAETVVITQEFGNKDIHIRVRREFIKSLIDELQWADDILNGAANE